MARVGAAKPSNGGSADQSATVAWSGTNTMDAPLVVLLHGWGETEADMMKWVPSLPAHLAYAGVRAPHLQGRRFGWFEPGRPFAVALQWFETWLDVVAPAGRPVVLVGFSAGAAFGGGVLLSHPQRYLGAALLCGTLPFDAGVSTPSGHLAGKEVFLAHRTEDEMIPAELLERAWTFLVQDSGARVRAARYAGPHGISPAMLADLAHWVAHVTKPTHETA